MQRVERWLQKLRYAFESALSAGTWPVMLWLAALVMLLVAAATVFLSLTNIATEAGTDPGPLEDAWQTLLRTLDPGTMAEDSGWPFRLVSLIATLVGVLIVSSLIGLIASAIDSKVSELRKGRSPVLVEGHTLILGWSSKVTTLISELVIANENHRSCHIVILAPMDKVEMEDIIRARVRDTKTTKVSCRTGNPADRLDLTMVNAPQAKSVIVLSPVTEAADAEVVRACLALRSLQPQPAGPIIAEMIEARRAAALRAVTGGQITIVMSAQVIAQIAAQVCRYQGLSHVFQELLDFDGDEIYFQYEPRLVGHTFGEAVLSYRTSSVLGIRRVDGTIQICPPMGSLIREGDSIIALSEDDDTVIADGTLGETVTDVARSAVTETQDPERLLILGWNPLGSDVLAALDPHLAAESSVHVVYDPAITDERHVPDDSDLSHTLVSASHGDTTDPDLIEDLLRARPYDHVVVLCHRHQITPTESDARALITLLLVRQTLSALESETSVLTELLDVSDVEIAPSQTGDDFLVSERLTSLMLSQLSENIELIDVFSEFFRPGGAELSIWPAERYVPLETPMLISDAVTAVCRFNELMVGFRVTTADGSRVVITNPDKAETVTFAPGTALIVISPRTTNRAIESEPTEASAERGDVQPAST